MKVSPVRNIYFYKLVHAEVTNNGHSTNVAVSWQDDKGKRTTKSGMVSSERTTSCKNLDSN